MPRNPWAFRVDYDKEIAAAEATLAALDAFIAAGGPALVTAVATKPTDLYHACDFLAYAANVDDLHARGRAVGLTPDEAEAAFTAYMDDWPAWATGLRDSYREGQAALRKIEVYDPAVASAAGWAKGIKAYRAGLKADIARWRRNRSLYGGRR